ncbi:hypothetical protein D3C75_1372110 [compost metagenome]
MMPNCTSTWIGRLARTAKVPARISPAEVITDPVSLTPSAIACFSGICLRFFQMLEIMKML